MKFKTYLAGDIMSYGSQMELKRLEDICDKYSWLDVYSPRKNKEINDKKNQTKESNDKLAEKILKQDTDKINESEIFIVNYKPHALGTTVELGQMLHLYFENPDNIDVIVVFDDIRRTDIEEKADRRSFSVNQYVHGAVLKMTNGVGFVGFEDVEDLLIKILNKRGIITN